jgi:hypothetical protein
MPGRLGEQLASRLKLGLLGTRGELSKGLSVRFCAQEDLPELAV